MSSREQILGTIKKNKPADIPLPSLHISKEPTDDVLARFSHTIAAIGGKVQEADDYKAVDSCFLQKQEQGVRVVNAIEGSAHYNGRELLKAGAGELESVHTFFVKGQLAVAENGAVWVSEKDMVNRLLPFLCEQLVMVVEEKNIVDTMHEAYEKIRVDAEGYGVFIAGPSKTADIEQSLVIGAHGPLGLEIFIIKNKNQIA